MSNMGADALKNNLSNPARTYLWEIMFVNPIGGGDEDVLNLRCQSTNIPGRSIGEILVPYKQSPGIKFPGKLAVSHTWPCVFIEGTDKKIFDAVYAWSQAVVHDRLNVGGPDVVIKSDIYLRLLDTKGNVTMKIRIVGCYPQAIDDTPIAYEDEDTLKYNVTFSFDFWEEITG